MKTLRLLTIVPTALAISLVFTEANLAQTPTIKINRNLQSDPLILNGKSGGTVKSNCGNITSRESREANAVAQRAWRALLCNGR